MDNLPKYTFQEAKVKLEAFCAYQDRCTFDISKKMNEWGLSDEDRSALFSYLKESRFLSDERFIESFISGKIRIKKWGRNKIFAALREKRIPEILIRSGMQDIPDDIYFSNLRTLASQKLDLLRKEKNELAKKVKLYRYLAGKGYTMDEINEVVRESF